MTPDERKQEFAQNKASLDQRDHLDRAFSPEYAAVKQEVRTARQQIKDYNKKIKDLKAGAKQPDSLKYDKPDAGNVPRQSKDQIRNLKYERGKLRNDTYNKVQTQTQRASPESQVQMHDAARKELQKGMSQKARDKQNSTRLEPGTKSIDRAQDRFFKKIVKTRKNPSGREQGSTAPRPEAPAQKPPSSPNAESKGPSVAIRFSVMPAYNKSAEKAMPSPTKSELSKDQQTPDKAEPPAPPRFFPSPNMDKAKQSHDNPSAPKTPSPTKSKDKYDR